MNHLDTFICIDVMGLGIVCPINGNSITKSILTQVLIQKSLLMLQTSNLILQIKLSHHQMESRKQCGRRWDKYCQERNEFTHDSVRWKRYLFNVAHVSLLPLLFCVKLMHLNISSKFCIINCLWDEKIRTKGNVSYSFWWQ